MNRYEASDIAFVARMMLQCKSKKSRAYIKDQIIFYFLQKSNDPDYTKALHNILEEDYTGLIHPDEVAKYRKVPKS